ncbi:transposase [Tautonia rosea]|uniref:transposase n=1 Tax=Tautonia rosea TaxID=2728037 RepID=UPI001473867C|nr:transposase [Tautonia rosea]
MAAFLRELLRHLGGKVIVIWDGGSNYKSPLIRELLVRFPQLHLERLPGDAPDLNPVELIWSHVKHGRMANFVLRHVWHLDRVVRGQLSKLVEEPGMIRSLGSGSKLPFLDKNLAT